MALASAVYLSVLGKHGLRQVAELCYHKAHYAAEQIRKPEGLRRLEPGRVLPRVRRALPAPRRRDQPHLLEECDSLGGYDLGRDYPALKDHMLIAVTEMNSKEQIDVWSPGSRRWLDV